MTEVVTEEVVTEEVSPVIAGDITEVTEKLEELKEVLTEEKEPEKVLVDDVEMTSEEVLVEILNTLQPDPEQQELALTNVESEMELLQGILNALETQQATTLEHQEIALQQHSELVEGNFFVGLSVVISFAIYMFWNQLSKW